MERVWRPIGPLATNVHLLADPRTREAIVIDAAIPGLTWISAELEARGWRLRLIVSTHGHWDHTGENAALQAWSGHQQASGASPRRAPGAPGEPAAMTYPRAPAGSVVAEPAMATDHLRLSGPAGSWHDPGGPAAIAAHPDDWHRLLEPEPLFAPFPIPACVPAVELVEGGIVRFGSIRLEVLHTPGHTEGSVCLLAPDDGLLFSGDTLFAGGWGRVDLPGGDAGAMVESLARLATLDGWLRVLPGHGPVTTIERERPWLELVAREGRLPV